MWALDLLLQQDAIHPVAVQNNKTCLNWMDPPISTRHQTKSGSCGLRRLVHHFRRKCAVNIYCLRVSYSANNQPVICTMGLIYYLK